MLLSKRSTEEFLDRELDSFLWMKGLTRRDLESELRYFDVRPQFKTPPWLHQLVCFYIGYHNPRFLFFLDMGLGKTKIIADLMTQRKRERNLEKGLVCVPRAINLGSWADDLAVHSDLKPTLVDVEDIEEKWRRLSNPDGDLTIIDYQSLQWAVCKKAPGKKKGKNQLIVDSKRIARVKQLYNFIGVDEIHKAGGEGTLWFDFMCEICHAADYVYGATGTPFGKDPIEMWPQFYMVDQGETLGETKALFLNSFYTSATDPFKGLVFHYRRRMARDLQRMIQHRSIRYDSREVPELDLPKLVYRSVLVDMADEQEEHYLRALEGIINSSNSSSDEVKACWATLRRIGSGYLKWKDSYGDHKVMFKHNPKLEALERLLDEAGDKKLVISHEYTDTGELIHKRLDELGIKHEWLYGGSKERTGLRERFINDPNCRVFLMNSEAGGTGTNGLQAVAHYLVFFESPPNPKTREQTEKRIYRPGQKERTFIYDLVARKTVDRRILDAIKEGRDLFEEVVNGRKFDKGFF